PGAALAGGEQPHAHLMYSERTVDSIERGAEQYFRRYNGKHPELGGCRKDSAGTEERLFETRQRWAEVQNAHLQQYGHAAQMNHRSLAEQGIDWAPEQ
ncbi:MAG: MobA/MobL family protein, partial [Anaerolineae bacterium]|nr:MobA/MobL family protein [Anaerolineae bacterium]